MKTLPKRFIVIAGANGTGKTTLAKVFLNKYKIDYLNADEIADDMGLFRKNAVDGRIKAGKDFILRLRDAVKRKRPVTVESTLSGKYLLKVINKVRRAGFRVSINYYFVDSPEICLKRIKSRVEAGGHDVPKNDVIRRFFRSKTNFWRLYKNVADDWNLFYNGIERLMPVASGSKKIYDVFDDELLRLFMKDIK